MSKLFSVRCVRCLSIMWKLFPKFNLNKIWMLWKKGVPLNMKFYCLLSSLEEKYQNRRAEGKQVLNPLFISVLINVAVRFWNCCSGKFSSNFNCWRGLFSFTLILIWTPSGVWIGTKSEAKVSQGRGGPTRQFIARNPAVHTAA